MSAAWICVRRGGVGRAPVIIATEFGANPAIAVRANRIAIPEKNHRSSNGLAIPSAAMANEISLSVLLAQR